MYSGSRRSFLGVLLAASAATVLVIAAFAVLFPLQFDRGTAALRRILAPRPAGSSAPLQTADTVSDTTSTRTQDGSALSMPAISTDEEETIGVYERFNEAVVNITTEVIAMNWFFEPIPREGGSGSGSILDKRGYVLTNDHVVQGATRLYVNLSDGSRYEATLVGTDPENDLAVIKFDPPADRTLATIPYGVSARLKVGQKVLAIGNPFGLERTLTQGIISGIGRPVRTDSDTIIRDMIQTDASINPGNSGGPLLNAHGEMIGINTMIFSPSGGSVGIGFAVPVDTARRVVPELIANGRVRRGWIDIQGIPLFPDLLEYMHRSGAKVGITKGLLVSQVARGSGAEKAGLRGGTTAVRYGSTVFNLGGDIITMVDGVEIGTVADLYAALENNKPGEQVSVEFWRGTQKQKILVTLSERQTERR